MKIEQTTILHVWEDEKHFLEYLQDRERESIYSKQIDDKLRLNINDNVLVREDGKTHYYATVKNVCYDTFSGILFINAYKGI